MIYALKVPGILPTNLFTTYAIQIGSVLEVSLLAFALADRINMERTECQFKIHPESNCAGYWGPPRSVS